MTEVETRSGPADAPSAISGQALRTRAEETARESGARMPENMEALSPEQVRQVLHELQVHQIELEMQNEELRGTQEKLEASRARYFDLYDLAPVGYVTVSEQGLVLEANLTAATLFGVVRGTLVKRPLFHFILPEDQDIYYRHRKMLFETGAPQVWEMRLVKKDGTRFWARLEATVAQDAEGALVCRTVLSDVTERKRAEEALREANEYLQNLFNYANAPIIVWDPQFRITRFNHAFESLTGRKAEDVTGGSLEVLFPPALVESSMALIRNTMGGARRETVEIAILHLDGSVRTVLWNSATVFATDGKTPVAAIAQGQDITERKRAKDEKEKRTAELVIANAYLEKLTSEGKRAEAELAKYREHLEQLVQDRTAQLEAAQEELLRKERMAALGRMVATVSHEIRNPLGTIQSSIFSLGERVRGQDEAVDRVLARAERGIKRCDNIIEDLLSYTRNQPPNLTATDIDSWLAGLLDEVPIPEGIRVTKNLSCGVELPIDRERLYRGVVNIVDNACQAMSGNKGDRASLLTVETSVADGRVKIRVRDTGPGIPAGLLEKVFEPLYSTKTFGVGLGLAIVKQIMESHAGGVEVESREGEGTLVTLWLPYGEQEV